MPDVVTHTLTSVRRHHIKLSLPREPPPDKEAFVIEFEGHTRALSPPDYYQLVNTLLHSWRVITDQPIPEGK